MHPCVKDVSDVCLTTVEETVEKIFRAPVRNLGPS